VNISEGGRPEDHREYDDVAGTLVFDARRSRTGYELNKFLVSLNAAENRERFLRAEAEYLRNFDLTHEQVAAVLHRDWRRLLELGGQIFYIGKLAHLDGLTTQQLCARQAGMTDDEYMTMMRRGGRPVTGIRSSSKGPAERG
jgi:protocatechuate 4,5-dioxygenase alpha chain